MVKFTNFYFLLPGNQENDFFFLKVITLKEKSCIPSSYYYGKLFPLIIDLVSKLDITDKMMSKIPQKEVTNFSLQYFFFSFFFFFGGGGVYQPPTDLQWISDLRTMCPAGFDINGLIKLSSAIVCTYGGGVIKPVQQIE